MKTNLQFHGQDTRLSLIFWIKCFAIYVAVVSRKQLQRVSEMLGYLILILEAQMEYAVVTGG